MLFVHQILQELKEKALKRAGLVEDDVLHLIEERSQARINKDFARSDKVRTDLTAKGIALMDVGNETIWRPCIPSEPLVAQAVQTDNKTPKLEEKQSTPTVEKLAIDGEGNGPQTST